MKKKIGWIVTANAICIATGIFGFLSLRPKPLPQEAVNAEMAALLEQAAQPDREQVPKQAAQPNRGQGLKQAAQPDRDQVPKQSAPEDKPPSNENKRQDDAGPPTDKMPEPAEKNNLQASAPLLDLNAATPDQLMDLPGIGASKAKAIVELRTRLGRFSSVEQLKDVKGIGDKMFEKIKPHIIVEGR